MTLSRTTTAIVFSLMALALFDFMGLVIKHLSPSYSAAELSAYRNLTGLIPAFIALQSSRAWHGQGKPFRLRQWRLAIFRGLIVTLAQLSFYLSLGVLSFATASTITYANALFMTALAVPILGEKVGGIRWGAVIIGFVGVVMIVGPGRDSFSLYALLPLGAAFFYALSGVTARLMDEDVPSPLLNLYSAGAAAVGALVLAVAFGGFSPIRSGNDLLWILAMGGFGGTAVLLLTVAFRMTEQSNLAPFSYFGIPLAFLMGWVIFDEAPWNELFPGSLLIIAGGMMIIWRERRLRRATIELPVRR